MTMIKIKNFTKQFGNREVFNNFDLEINSGEMVALTGPSGCGKTTLMNTIGLIEPVEKGAYYLFDKKAPSINSKGANQLIRQKISYLFQNFALVDNKTVGENLMMALKYVKKSKQWKTDAIHNALIQVGLEHYQNQKVYELSGGEQQRVAIARAILKPSEIILADEPTGALDPGNRDEIMGILTELNRAGKTIIIVTHDQEVAKSCQRIVYLRYSFSDSLSES